MQGDVLGELLAARSVADDAHLVASAAIRIGVSWADSQVGEAAIGGSGCHGYGGEYGRYQAAVVRCGATSMRMIGLVRRQASHRSSLSASGQLRRRGYWGTVTAA